MNHHACYIRGLYVMWNGNPYDNIVGSAPEWSPLCVTIMGQEWSPLCYQNGTGAVAGIYTLRGITN